MEKVNLSVSKLFLAVHRSSKWIMVPPVSIASCVTFIGALEQLRDSSWRIQGQISEKKSLKKFFVCDSCCGQNVDLDREEGNLRSYYRSITLLPMFVRYVGECALTATVWRERERERERGRAISKKRQKRSAQVDVLCLFVCFAALQDGGLSEMSSFSSMVSSISGTSGERFLTITFRFLCEVLCLFFGGLIVFSALPHWFSKKVGRET